LRLYNKPSLYHTQCFFERLKDLSDRLSGVPLQEKSKSWVMGKVARPSLDSLGGWLEGHITKFIAGDGEIPTTIDHSGSSYQNANYSGAFSGYSTISSAHSSRCPSPVPTSSQTAPQTYPARPPNVNRATININRASSAMDSVRNIRATSPIARIASANPSTKVTVNGAESYIGANGYKQQFYSEDDFEEPNNSAAFKPNPNWWDGNGTTAQTPVAATFYKVEQFEGSDGFTSLMGNSHTSFAAAPVTINPYSSSRNLEEEEDLGFGNPKQRPENPILEDGPKSEAKQDANESAKPSHSENDKPQGMFVPSYKNK
jgi:COPII coat assembly protein SEC16